MLLLPTLIVKLMIRYCRMLMAIYRQGLILKINNYRKKKVNKLPKNKQVTKLNRIPDLKKK